MGGHIDVRSSDALVTLGLPALDSVGGHTNAHSSGALVTLGLPALGSVDGYLQLPPWHSMSQDECQDAECQAGMSTSKSNHP